MLDPLANRFNLGGDEGDGVGGGVVNW